MQHSDIKTKENEKQIRFNSNIQPSELREYFKTVLPKFDEERVYPSDIKKIMAWYNLLITSGITDFEKKETEESAEGETAPVESEKAKEPKTKAPAKASTKAPAKAAAKTSAKTSAKAPTKTRTRDRKSTRLNSSH